jgi:hypothetical protein
MVSMYSSMSSSMPWACARKPVQSSGSRDPRATGAAVCSSAVPRLLILSRTSFSLSWRALTQRFTQLEGHLSRGLLIRVSSGLAGDRKWHSSGRETPPIHNVSDRDVSSF